MDTIQKFAVIFLKLPDGRYVFQRRTGDATYGARQLGMFGGHCEPGEEPDACMRREIGEEISLSPNELAITFVKEVLMPKSADYDRDRHFFVYTAAVPDMNFSVYEGQGAEAYTLDQLVARTDVVKSLHYILARVTL